jgi:predicted N-formylglutamate amidohydrolase
MDGVSQRRWSATVVEHCAQQEISLVYCGIRQDQIRYEDP